MKKLNNIILRCLPFLGLLLLLLVPNAAYAQTPVEDDAAAVTLTVLAPPSFTFCPPGSDLGCNPASVPFNNPYFGVGRNHQHWVSTFTNQDLYGNRWMWKHRYLHAGIYLDGRSTRCANLSCKYDNNCLPNTSSR